MRGGLVWLVHCGGGQRSDAGVHTDAYALLQKTPQPTFAQILKHMDDNLCRCGSHTRVVEAIQEAAGTSKEPA
jgi:nicotinate dehydrogenase subunit A